jgi:hypothetical protein
MTVHSKMKTRTIVISLLSCILVGCANHMSKSNLFPVDELQEVQKILHLIALNDFQVGGDDNLRVKNKLRSDVLMLIKPFGNNLLVGIRKNRSTLICNFVVSKNRLEIYTEQIVPDPNSYLGFSMKTSEKAGVYSVLFENKFCFEYDRSTKRLILWGVLIH